MTTGKRIKIVHDEESAGLTPLVNILTIIEKIIMKEERSQYIGSVHSLNIGAAEKEIFNRIISELERRQRCNHECRIENPDAYAPYKISIESLENLQKKIYQISKRTRFYANSPLDQGDFVTEIADSLQKTGDALETCKKEICYYEESLIKSNNQLTSMSGVIRHDIMNLIMAILGYAEIAREDTNDPGIIGYFKKIETITREIQAHLIFTRQYETIGVNKPRWINPSDLTSHLAIPPPVSGNFELENVEIYINPMFETVLLNLLTNSLHHGQKITRISFTSHRFGEDLIFTWEDDGIGVPSSDKERIFKRGYGKDTGLGLFLVREILSRTNIEITETGTPGSGACFQMIVPAGYWRIPS